MWKREIEMKACKPGVPGVPRAWSAWQQTLGLGAHACRSQGPRRAQARPIRPIKPIKGNFSCLASASGPCTSLKPQQAGTLRAQPEPSPRTNRPGRLVSTLRPPRRPKCSRSRRSDKSRQCHAPNRPRAASQPAASLADPFLARAWLVVYRH